MKKFFLCFFCILLQLLVNNTFAQKRIKVLIIDGQNNHVQWPKTTYMMKTYLEQTKKFKVDVVRSAYTWKGEEYKDSFAIAGVPATKFTEKPTYDSLFAPKWKKYDVVICNFGWNATEWSMKTKKSFEKYIEKGGGLVVVHAADNSYPKWKAYNQMIGLGGWGDRTEKDGPYVYYDDNGKLQRDMTSGRGGSHGPQHEFVIKMRNTNHPITKGIPTSWLHTKDELYDRLRGPAENMEILATAYSSIDQKGTGRHEPVLMTLNYGKGKVFHTILGHVDYSIQCVGFITTFLRGTEWAATGNVTIPVPSDFPTETSTSSRPFKK
jgi:type 1 glutamine amidotransferase